MKRTVKRTISLFLATAMALSFAGCGKATASSAAASSVSGSTAASAAATGYEDLEPVELLLADSAAKGAAGQLFDEMFAQKLEEITGGKLTIDLHTNGDLGNDLDLLRQMNNGDIDIVGCQIAPVVSFIPQMAIFDLPMVFAQYSGDTIDKVLNGDTETRKAMAQAYEKNNWVYLGILQNATYRLTTANVELKDLASFKDLQIRTMENANHMAFWSAIGAEPTPLAWAEVYFALQSGAIDAQENAADTCASANFDEVQKYLACTNHILYANQLSMNKEKYDSLDPAYQQAIAEAVTAAIAEMRTKMVDIDQTNKKALEDKGMTIIEYDNSFFQEVLALDSVKALYQDIDKQVGGLGTTLQNELAANK